MKHYTNKEDFDSKFWDHNYRILVTAQGIEFIVNADNNQDALDYIIDYCEENLPGLLFSRDEENEKEFLDEYVCGGNKGLYLNTHHIHIEEI